MKRRTLLQFLVASFVTAFGRLRLFAQSSSDLTDANLEALDALAEAALPSALGANGRATVVRDFVSWHRNYREGADRGHGYGSSRLRPPSGPPPARQYPPQFAQLDADAVAAGATAFAALAVDGRRTIIERRLNEPQPTNRLPRAPTGDNLVADFIGFYFNSPDAWDRSYQAEIGSDRCRGLQGSDQAPPPFGGR